LSVLVAVLTLVLLAAVIAVVSRPLLSARAPRDTDMASELEMPRREELEAAREAKYREIRDAELDYRTGKLSSQDFEAVNGTLRAEALEILNRLEALDSGALETAAVDTEALALEIHGDRHLENDARAGRGRPDEGEDPISRVP
jgi:hypothetical protein